MNAIFDYKPNPADNLYTIIGCDELSSAEQILAEYRIRAVDCHPDKNREDPHAVERFQKLHRAKEILTDELSRYDYDTWRRSGISIPYEEWQARKDSVKMSMHWMTKTKKEPAIESGKDSEDISESQERSFVEGGQGPKKSSSDGQQKNAESRISWTRNDGTDMLEKFRNYEI